MKKQGKDESGSSDSKEASVSSNDNNGFFTPNSKIDFSDVKIEDFLTDQVDFDTFCKSYFRAVNNKKDSDEEELHLLMVDNHIPAGAKLC